MRLQPDTHHGAGHAWPAAEPAVKGELRERAMLARAAIADAQIVLSGIIMALSRRPRDRGRYDRAHAYLVMADRELRMARREGDSGVGDSDSVA